MAVLDPNGSQITDDHDLLDRLTDRTINPGIGVVGSTFEAFQYDGLSRLVLGADDDSTVFRGYDSLSRVTEAAGVEHGRQRDVVHCIVPVRRSKSARHV